MSSSDTYSLRDLETEVCGTKSSVFECDLASGTLLVREFGSDCGGDYECAFTLEGTLTFESSEGWPVRGEIHLEVDSEHDASCQPDSFSSNG